MKNHKKIGIALLIGIVVLSYGVYWAFYDMDRLPTGELISESTSPTGAYTLKAYRVNGGATVSYAVRGELCNNISKENPKNIYWNYKESEAYMKWKDDDTVVINGHSLNVRKEKYDWRRIKK